ncbi:MAG TPA: diguanylate cyclase [Acidobacteriota bacterium]|jgi:PleD family two-component response regulator
MSLTAMNFKQRSGELLRAFQPDRPCLNSELFFHSLEEELARALRYQFFVALLLFRIPKDQDALFANLARFLRACVRQNDGVGTLSNRTLAVILLNSKAENCLSVLQRLKSDFLLSVSKEHKAVSLKASCAVYPSEAENLTSLYNIALKRLRAQKYTNLTIS